MYYWVLCKGRIILSLVLLILSTDANHSMSSRFLAGVWECWWGRLQLRMIPRFLHYGTGWLCHFLSWRKWYEEQKEIQRLGVQQVGRQWMDPLTLSIPQHLIKSFLPACLLVYFSFLLGDLTYPKASDTNPTLMSPKTLAPSQILSLIESHPSNWKFPSGFSHSCLNYNLSNIGFNYLPFHD